MTAGNPMRCCCCARPAEDRCQRCQRPVCLTCWIQGLPEVLTLCPWCQIDEKDYP